MATTSVETPAPPRFRLQTFGTLRLVRLADDTVVGDHGHQRRRLAFLALLAASGERGRSRDQLLGLFWPDVSQSRARHSLEQLLYALRTSLDGSVFTGANPIRLNAAFISSDIGDFTGALARGALGTAVDLYRGPFLEGFYLSAAPEFEQWTDAERGRIERSYMDALERLAKSAEEANDSAAATRLLQKLIDTDPVSSKHAIGLIRALMNGGDHVAALRYAERYEAIVARELGTSVGPEVSGLVAEVRARAKTKSVVVRGSAPPARPPRDRDSPASVARAADAPESLHAAPERSAVSTPRVGARRRAVALYGSVALALAALVVAASWLRTRAAADPATAATAPSIAVLPLANLSGDPRDAVLVDGLTEELIGVLARIDRLRVVARTSAFAFRNSNIGVRRIADSLHVSHILEGSVQKAGQRLHVQMRLVDGRNGSTQWSETYDRELKDIFLVQSDIAAAVARELAIRLGGRTVAALRKRPTQNIAAYELYLRGSDPALLRSDSGTRRGVEYFKQAIALDPAYAAAYAGLARMYHVLLLGQRSTTSPREMYALAEAAALKAVALDDSLAEGHGEVGAVLMVRYDLAAAEKELKRAAAIDPGDSRIPKELAKLYLWAGRPADAVAEVEHALDNDPLSPSTQVELARALCANRESAQGLARLKRVEAVRPPLLRLPLYEGLCHAMQQDWPAAVAALRRSRENRGRGFLGYALVRGGQREQALIILADLMNHSARTGQGAFEVAVVHAGLGNRDQAFAWLDRSVDDLSLSENIMLPVFDDLHADPRFERLRRRLGR